MRIRRLEQVQSDGDARWFQPAIDRFRRLPADDDARVRGFFGLENPVWIARAPGRLDVMGGIADYSGATVLQLPLDRSTFAVLQRQTAPRCDVVTRRGDLWDACVMDLAPFIGGRLSDPAALAAWFGSRSRDLWAAYVIGVVQYCLQRAPAGGPANDARPGLRLLIDSTVPEGKGVSSSAAVEVAVMTVVAASYGVELSPEGMASACQWVENHIVGAPCGIMDQMTSACGQTDRLLRIRCQPGTIEGSLEIPHGYRLFGIDSGLRHAVTGADYGTVRTAAFMGYRIVADLVGLTATAEGKRGRVRVADPTWHGYLANIDPDDFAERFQAKLPAWMLGSEFLERYGGITDPVTRVVRDREYPVRVATAHPVNEQRRVLRFADGLPQVDTVAAELGRLMASSHKSYTDCGLGSHGTNRLVTLVEEAGVGRGLFGAKITGGGSGGTVAVLGRADAEDAVHEIAATYTKETGLQAEVFSASGPGAAETGVLILEH